MRSTVNDDRVSNYDNSLFSCKGFTGNSFIGHNWVVTPDNIKCGNGNNITPHPHRFMHGPKTLLSVIVLIALGINCNYLSIGNYDTIGASTSCNSNRTMDPGKPIYTPKERSSVEVRSGSKVDHPPAKAADSLGTARNSPQQLRDDVPARGETQRKVTQQDDETVSVTPKAWNKPVTTTSVPTDWTPV